MHGPKCFRAQDQSKGIDLMKTEIDVPISELPMQSVSCTECIARVQVRKSTWQQTSIQWNSEALEACRERPLAGQGGSPKEQFVGCETIRAEIREAALQDRLNGL